MSQTEQTDTNTTPEAAANPAAATPAAPPAADELLLAAKKDAAAAQERYLRAVADLENFRKRTVRDKDELRQFANSGLMEDLIPVLDNLGLDYDPRKIEAARRGAIITHAREVSFAHHDVRNGLPAHQGNVSILDILQFFTPEEQETLLKLAASRVAPGGMLIIRSGLRDASWRFKITVLGDWLAKATFWMKAAPTHYPSADDFQKILSPFGNVKISPLWGGTPFNNHLIILRTWDLG